MNYEDAAYSISNLVDGLMKAARYKRSEAVSMYHKGWPVPRIAKKLRVSEKWVNETLAGDNARG